MRFGFRPALPRARAERSGLAVRSVPPLNPYILGKMAWGAQFLAWSGCRLGCALLLLPATRAFAQDCTEGETCGYVVQRGDILSLIA